MTLDPVKLTSATPADLPDIVALMNHAYRGAQSWAVEDTYIAGDRIALPDLTAERNAKPHLRLLVWRDPDLLGCVSLEPFATMKPDAVWYLSMLTVTPDRQAAQLGRRLLAEAERIAAADGAVRMRLSVVWLRETLIAWYERRGYVRTGETVPFPYGDERWGKPLRDDLHFVVLEKLL